MKNRVTARSRPTRHFYLDMHVFFCASRLVRQSVCSVTAVPHNILHLLLLRSPPICRAEGDVPDGSHKLSPNSDSSLETHKTCGE